MKKLLFSTCLLTALFISHLSFAQTPDKQKLINEVNEQLKSQKLWDYEGMSFDDKGYVKYIMCLSADCNPYVSWDVLVNYIKTIELTKIDDYDCIVLTCAEGDCIVPAGYEPGGRYEKKGSIEYFIKDKKTGKEIVEKLNALKNMEWK